MILIQRGKEPDSLLKFRKKYPEAGYEQLQTEELRDIREQMWEEQKGLCAYCMRSISSPHVVRIEHYVARHPKGRKYNPKATLNYKIMLGVCYGNSIVPGTRLEDRTCDAHRENMALTVNPFEVNSIRKIHYRSDGYITSVDDDIRFDVEQTLNLNCRASSLPDNRKRVLVQTQREIQDMCKNKGHEAYMRVLKARYKRYVVDRAYTPYCGIVIEWLEKELGIN